MLFSKHIHKAAILRKGNERGFLVLSIIAVGLASYILGFELLLPVVLLISTTLYLPLPKLFDSWLSRLVVSLMILYALIQIAAALQFILLPHSRFNALAVILTLLSVLVLLAFRQPKIPSGMKLISLKDLLAITACLFFLLPFFAAAHGKDPLAYISQVADSQVVDGIAHYNDITKFTT